MGAHRGAMLLTGIRVEKHFRGAHDAVFVAADSVRPRQCHPKDRLRGVLAFAHAFGFSG
jgi:hypothetical protein